MTSARPTRRALGAFALLAPIALATLPACRPARAESRALVFAAASLTAPFTELARAFEAAHPGRAIELHFAGTAQLVVQLREGAPADLFASADEENMRRVLETGRALGEPRLFARNSLAIVVRRGNPLAIEGLADLARDDAIVLLCGPEVPAGRYARRALASAGVTARSASDEPSVAAVTAKLRLGEADAGLVYATDALGARDELDSIPLPPEHDVVARYPVARLDGEGDAATADAFVDFLISETGAAILAAHGFLAP